MVHLQLQTQGKTFTVTVGHLPFWSRKKAFKVWQTLAKLMNKLPPQSKEWFEHVWNQHLLGSNLDYFATFASGIQEKGIVIPELALLQAVGEA